MTAWTQTLSDLTRWLGIVVAIVGAVLANPDATEHAVREFRDRWVARWRRFRGSLAGYLKFLRRNATIDSTPSGASAAGGTTQVSTQVSIAWNVEAATKKDLAFLIEVTELLSKSVSKLWQRMDMVTILFKDQLNEAVESLREATDQVDKALDAFRSDVVRSDASALPIIVIGVALSGLSPDVTRLPWGLGVAIPVIGFYLAGRRSWRIVRERRDRRRSRAEVATA